jgi:hypothetical protein
MVKVERIDFEDSFMTTLVFTDGNKGQEISVCMGSRCNTSIIKIITSKCSNGILQ